MNIDQTDFSKRRQHLMAEVEIGNIAIIGSAPTATRNRDIDYPFRQNSDFYYLTGFGEPDALAVFIPGREQGEYILFCREYDATKALWEGAHAGLDGARNDYLADDAFPIEDLDDILPGMLENKEKVFYPMGRDSELDHHLQEWLNQLRSQSRSGISAPMELISLEHMLHEMRLIKSEYEIRKLQQAADVSAKAHVRVMQASRPSVYEYQIESEFIHECMQHGLRSVAYPSIVAAGENACTLHYTENRAELLEGQLLLIDAGAECDHYAADITRTFPVSGQFSDAQKLLYQLVLDAQLAAIDKVKPGTHWIQPHEIAVEVLTCGLVALGLLKGEVSELIESEGYKQFFMHRIGHWLGMDVHDVGDYKINGEWRLLQPGMVLTVEPGLYIPPDCETVEQRWRGIGIRIEDDVIVTASGCDVLTKAVPKSIEEIEAVMRMDV